MNTLRKDLDIHSTRMARVAVGRLIAGLVVGRYSDLRIGKFGEITSSGSAVAKMRIIFSLPAYPLSTSSYALTYQSFAFSEMFFLTSAGGAEGQGPARGWSLCVIYRVQKKHFDVCKIWVERIAYSLFSRLVFI